MDGFKLANISKEMELFIFPTPLHRLKLLIFKLRVNVEIDFEKLKKEELLAELDEKLSLAEKKLAFANERIESAQNILTFIESCLIAVKKEEKIAKTPKKSAIRLFTPAKSSTPKIN